MASTSERGASKSSTQQRFYKAFQERSNALQRQIDQLSDTALSGQGRTEATDACLGAIAGLSDEVKEAAVVLSAHDQRTYSDVIKGLTTRLQDVREASAPRKKFSFKNARKTGEAGTGSLGAGSRRQDVGLGGSEESGKVNSVLASSPAPEAPSTSTGSGSRKLENADDDEESSRNQDSIPPFSKKPGEIWRPMFESAKAIDISNVSDVHVVLPEGASHATTRCVVRGLRRSIIDMSTPTGHGGHPFDTVSLNRSVHSVIVCGHVDGPVMSLSLERCVIVAACRQFRMHECVDCDVYLQVGSRPIVEDCKRVRFASMPDAYRTETDRCVENKWDQVNDFKWLKSEPSPNWKTLPEDEIIKEEVWMDLVSGSHDYSREHILNAVGIRTVMPE